MQKLGFDKLLKLKVSSKNDTAIDAESFYLIEEDKVSVKGSLTSSFSNLESGLLEVSYDFSDDKKATFLMQRGDHVLQIDAGASLEPESGTFTLAFTNSETEKNVNMTVSYDTTSADSSIARFSVDVNDIKYEVDGQLVSQDENGQLLIAFNAAGEEVMKIDAKYENAESTKTGSISLDMDDQRYQIVYKADLMDDSLAVSVDVSDSMEFAVNLNGKFDRCEATKSAQITINYNDNSLEWTGMTEFSNLKGLIQSEVKPLKITFQSFRCNLHELIGTVLLIEIQKLI